MRRSFVLGCCVAMVLALCAGCPGPKTVAPGSQTGPAGPSGPSGPAVPPGRGGLTEQQLIDQLPRIGVLDGSVHTYAYRMGWDELKPKLAGTTTLAVVEEPGLQAFFAEVRRMGDRGDKFGPAYRFMVDACMQELVLFGRAVGPDDEAPGKLHSLYGLTVRPSDSHRADFDVARQAAWTAMETSGLLPKTAVRPGAAGAIGNVPFVANGEDEHVMLSAWDGKALHLAGNAAAAKWMASQSPVAGQSLARSPQFVATVKPLMAGQSSVPVALYYHDLRPLWQRHADGLWKRLSWRSIESLAGASFIEGKGWRNRHYWKLGDDRVGMFAHTKGGSVNQEWLKRVPADASAFITGYWDPGSMMLSAVGLASGVAGMVGDGEQSALDQPEVGVAFKAVESLFAQMGSRYLYYRRPGHYGSFPMMNAVPAADMVLAVELRDGPKFAGQLAELLDAVHGPKMVESAYKGYRIKQLLVLYMVVLKDVAIIAFHPQLLKDALDNWDKPGPSVLDMPAWKAAAGRLVANPCFVWYIAPGGFIRGIYDHYIPMLQQGQAFMSAGGMFFGGDSDMAAVPERQRPFNGLLLPRGSDFTRHITEATILSAHDDGAGVTFDGYAPLLNASYYWVGLQVMFKPLNFPKTSLLLPFQYVAMPAQLGEGPGDSHDGPRPLPGRVPPPGPPPDIDP